MKKPVLGRIQRRILALLKRHRKGISEGEMRVALGIAAADQVQFGRRRRELHYYYRIRKKRVGTKTVYIYDGVLRRPRDTSTMDAKTRALILHNAHGRCGMCGRTVEKHGIVLVVDHKVPRDWGGKTVPENLWALCEDCNQGKKNLFASVDSPAMRRTMGHASVHMRIGELLKAAGRHKPVPSYLLEFVAGQDDWQKRLRELRYLGWTIRSSKRRLPSGRVLSSYQLDKSTAWPPDPSKWIRDYEQRRATRNKRKRK